MNSWKVNLDFFKRCKIIMNFVQTYCIRKQVVVTYSLTGQKDDIGSLGITLELCAGIVDKEGKSLAEIAAEEVEEECGYHVDLKQVEFVQTFRGAIGTGSLNEKWIIT